MCSCDKPLGQLLLFVIEGGNHPIYSIRDAAILWAALGFLHLRTPATIVPGAALAALSLWAAAKVVQFAIDAETKPDNN